MAISTFKDEFDGGTRPNRFEVLIPTPSGDLQSLLVKAASIPEETIGILQIPFRGRVAKLPGDRAYAEWSFTVLDDTTHQLRAMMVQWHRTFNKHMENTPDAKETLGGGGKNYKIVTVKQLDMMGGDHTCVKLMVSWPVSVGAIDLSYDTADQATEFTCTLAYDYLEDCSSHKATPSPENKGDVGTDDSDTYANWVDDAYHV